MSHGDDEDLALEFIWTVGGQRLASRGPDVALHRARKGDSVDVTVVAFIRGSQSAPYSASTEVANRPPRISRVQISPSSQIAVGQEITALPLAKDPDGDPMTFHYRWTINGSTSEEQSATLATSGLTRGDAIQVEVVASDADDDSEGMDSRVITLVNSAPRIVSQPGDADDDGVFRYRVIAEDPDGDRVARFSLVQAPDGMTIDAAHGEIEWSPKQNQQGNHVVEIVVEDIAGASSSQRFEMIIGEPLDQS